MAGTLSVFGIRHHGPGSARVLVRALDTLDPTIVLVEGPPDAADVLAFAAHQDMSPPVALLVYETDAPTSAVYYPFATFSPEWQALRWALKKGVPARFIDLPQSLRPRDDRSADDGRGPEPAPDAGRARSRTGRRRIPQRRAIRSMRLRSRRGSLTAKPGGAVSSKNATPMTIRSGSSTRSTARWRRRARSSVARRAIRRSLRARRTCARPSAPRSRRASNASSSSAARGMRPCSRRTPSSAIPAKQDDELLKRLPKRKTAATWIPWTYDRLCVDSGYGAGVASPGWYDHLWVHREQLSARWMIRVARLLRDEDLDASPANVIESVRLADSLAAIRGRQAAGLDELDEATLSVLCHGNPMPVRLIQRTLVVGQRLGQVPDAVPMVPLQRDLDRAPEIAAAEGVGRRDDPRPRSAKRQRPGSQPPAASPPHSRRRMGRTAGGSAPAGQHVSRDLDAAMAARVCRQGHRGGAMGKHRGRRGRRHR